MRGLKAIFLFTIYLFQYITLTAVPGKSEREIFLPDSLKDNQILYNGRIWRNLYYMVQEDQFLETRDFMPGSVTISREEFKNVQLKYDLFKDELLIPVQNGILQLNKELIDSFSISYPLKTYRFIKTREDNASESAFFEVLYEGRTSLFVRHIKKIDKMAVEGKFDKFYQIDKVYLRINDKFYPISKSRDLLNLLNDKNEQVKEFLKKTRLRPSEKIPETYIPLLRFYDNLNQ